MSNIRDLFSDRRSDDEDDSDDENNRFVGGIGDRGGGSGLAVRPNPNAEPSDGTDPDAIFRLADHASSGDEQAQVRRTITMYRDGFVVDDGPYRRLDDPNNREFLTSLAKGQTPLEMFEDEVGKGAGGDVVVGLIDKRSEDYVEPFRSFSGAGQSLGSASQGGPPQDDGTVFDPSSLSGPPPPPPAGASSATTTAIQVRLINGQRRVVRLDVNATVQDLAASVGDAASGRFRLVAGFPPQAVRSAATILEAGLKGAQVSMQSVD